MAYVYQHTRNDTGEIFYIGIGKMAEHKRAYWKTRRSLHWKSIVNKHGYTATITHDNIVWQEAVVIEKYLIAFYGRSDNGTGILCNKSDGGDGANGVIRTPEVRLKMSISKTGKKLSDEHKASIGKAHFGKKRSIEAKKNMSIIQKKIKVGSSSPMAGKKHSDESKLRMSIARKGKSFSDETKKRLSESGKKYWENKKTQWQ